MNARRLILATLCAAVGVSAFSSAPAQAELTHHYTGKSFGPGGLSAGGPRGAFKDLQGIAVQQSTGDVYVYGDEAGSNEEEEEGGFIYKFNAQGEPADFSALGTNVIKGVGESSLKDEREIAVDDSSGPDSGDIFVTAGEVGEGEGSVLIYNAKGERTGELTEKHGVPWGSPCGVAVDPEGNVYVGLNGFGVNKYTPKTGTLTDADYVSSLSGKEVKETCNVAAVAGGDVYAAPHAYENIYEDFEGPVTKFESSQFNTDKTSAVGTLVDERGSTLAVDPVSGEVFVDESDAIAQYGSSGEPLLGSFGEAGPGAFNKTELDGGGTSYGVAVDHASGEVYVDDKSVVEIFGPDLVIPDVSVEPASDLLPSSVTLNGTVDPLETSVTACEFEYGTTTSYGQSAPCSKAVPFSGDSPVAVSAGVVGLQAGTVYDFRLTVSNANGTNRSGGQFTTPGPRIDEESVVEVTSTSVDLQARIDPLGSDTRYYFQYGAGDCAAGSSSCTDVPLPPGVDIGSTESDQGASFFIERGLSPGTVYRYRVVASNAHGTAEGIERTFTTQREAREGFVLPDGRAYELVSPPSKHGGLIEPISEAFGTIQAAEDGDAIAYPAIAPIVEDPSGNQLYNTETLSVRGPEGWSSQDISPANDVVSGARVGNPNAYEVFSPDLSVGLLVPFGSPPLSPGAQEYGPYLRITAACETTPEECYLPLVTRANVPAGTNLEKANASTISFEGATPDLSHVVLSSEVALTSTPITQLTSLYEWAEGQLQLVSVLPGEGGAPAPVPRFGGIGNSRHAISNDGSRIVWSAERHLYMRDTATRETVELDANQGATEPGTGEPVFQTANAEGSRVFFTDEQRLTGDSTAGGRGDTGGDESDLYECEIVEGPGGLACDLTDLTVDEHERESAGVQGLIAGASEDGSYVYFVADGVLASGAAPGTCSYEPYPAGETCNLYVRHDGTTTFIAALSSEDYPDFASALSTLTARVSPDGQYLAFMSDRPLTGYDNTDVNEETGQHADEEVFLYDAGSERLVCASCDPSGARPVGVYTGTTPPPLVNAARTFSKRWLAGSIPGWTPYALDEDAYQSRYLSDSGRLFFNSADALVPQDVNGKEDVYEYEPPGVGSCEASSATFSAGAEGCVGLISSGTSDEESVFLDAGVNGDDVFFLTTAQLVSQDYDSAYDVYDAHVCSQASPCTPSPPAAPPPCDTADSCKPAPAPQPQTFGPSGSATFSGAGNLVAPISQPAVKAKPKVKPLTRAQKLAKALKACKRKPKKKRASCKAKAKKRYGAKSKAKRSHKVHAKKSGR